MKQHLSSIQSIVFDLDGTLVNTAPDVRLALNHMLSEYHLPEIVGDEVYDLIGLGAMSMIQKAFAKFNQPLPQEELAAARASYLDYYQKHPVVQSYIYADVIPVLDELFNQGKQLGICTNKPTLMTHLVLEKLQLKKYFRAIVAGDDLTQLKPHGQHILEVLKRMDCKIENAVMVGDSNIDLASAMHAGIDFIGVTYGYSRATINANTLIDHFRDLPNILDNMQSNCTKTIG